MAKRVWALQRIDIETMSMGPSNDSSIIPCRKISIVLVFKRTGSWLRKEKVVACDVDGLSGSYRRVGAERAIFSFDWPHLVKIREAIDNHGIKLRPPSTVMDIWLAAEKAVGEDIAATYADAQNQ